MSTNALEQLLARAVAVDPDAELKARIVALEAKVAALTGEAPVDAAAELDAARQELIDASSLPGEDLAVDLEADLEPEGVDFDDEGVDFDDLADDDLDPDAELGEEKAAGPWGACPKCGSTDRDEFADGTARCEHDGTMLKRGMAKKDDEAPLEVKAEPAGPAGPSLSELVARRQALGL